MKSERCDFSHLHGSNSAHFSTHSCTNSSHQLFHTCPGSRSRETTDTICCKFLDRQQKEPRRSHLQELKQEALKVWNITVASAELLLYIVHY